MFFDEKSRTMADECFEKIYPQISSCDVVTLTLPLTEQSKHMVDGEFLRNLKESAILINTSRGVNQRRGPDLASEECEIEPVFRARRFRERASLGQ